MLNVETPAEQLLFSTVRIECQSPDGLSTGTGFFYSREVNNSTAVFIVTNKHVIRESQVGRLFFTASEDGKPLIGERVDLQLDEFHGLWFDHPDPDIDICIMPFVPIVEYLQKAHKDIFYRSIPQEINLSEKFMKELDALEEVIFVGYPNGVFDAKHLLPIVRRGTTATPLHLDYEGKPQFLIDASVFPGSSGSPVLVCNSGGYSTRGNLSVGVRVIFLGVISQVLIRHDINSVDFISIPTSVVPLVRTTQMIDLGLVFKAATVESCVEAFLRSRGLLA